MRVKWLQAARANLIAVSEYITQDNPDAAARTVAAIVKAVETLEHFPSLGRPGRISGTRELVVSQTPYIIPYRVRGEVLEVLRVFHGARKWPNRF
ncbi:MAG: type II toxin-antitoxin system RelE/ParE family toxin [Terriglobales bacterium]